MNDELVFAVQIAMLIGLAIGVTAGWTICGARQDARNETIAADRAYWESEIARLRAQVAKLIGQDATPCDELHTRQNARQAEQAERPRLAA